jgi:transposase
MNVNTDTLPNDVSALKSIISDIVSDLTDRENTYKETQQYYEAENRLLKERINLLEHKLFGRKSEKLSVGKGQLLLFNEAELHATGEEAAAEQETITVPAHKRRRGKRACLPADLPRVEVEHDLPEEEKTCACGHEKTRIGEEISEQLDYIPAQIQVIKHIRYKYVCKSCEGVEADEAAVSIAPQPAQILPKSIASPGLIAQIITAKYVDALPLYRQEKIFERLGIELKRQTMSAWVVKVAEACSPLIELLFHEIRSGPYIQMDETTLQVLEEACRQASTNSYMWVMRGGSADTVAIVYRYDPSRSSDVAKQMLGDFTGYLQTDGYQGYEFVDELIGVKHLGCLAHARRKFVEAAKALGKGKKKAGSAQEALDYIAKLYALEQSARDQKLTAEQIQKLRRAKSKPILEKFKQWLEKKADQVPPGSHIGKAVFYTLGQWDRLTVYLEDGRLHPDNNLAENAIRPFVVGRKNWLFSATPDGAQASASLYSLIETAKANNLDPYWYLRYLFERLPLAETTQDYKNLLPNRVDREAVSPKK